MKTKSKELLGSFDKAITINKLKKALKEDKKLINKIKFFDEDRYTVTQNREIKETLLTLADGCLDVLVHWKDLEDKANLIEYKEEIYSIYNDELDETTEEVFKTGCGFFKLKTEEEQDRVLDHIMKKDSPATFCFWDFIEIDELEVLRGSYLYYDDYDNALKKYFVNTRKLRENLL